MRLQWQENILFQNSVLNLFKIPSGIYQSRSWDAAPSFIFFFPHLCQQLSFCQGNSCLIDHDNPRHLLIISWRERTNISPSARKLCCQISPVFLTHLKKDARGRHNIIGCAKVGRPLSFEESIYGVLEWWKLAPLHRGLSRCSPASLVGFD